jgi:hypothetical protein
MSPFALRGAGFLSQSDSGRRLVPWIVLGHYGVQAVLKPESFPIDKIYVPVKRRKALKPEVVQDIAESILEIGQQAASAFQNAGSDSLTGVVLISFGPAELTK